MSGSRSRQMALRRTLERDEKRVQPHQSDHTFSWTHFNVTSQKQSDVLTGFIDCPKGLDIRLMSKQKFTKQPSNYFQKEPQELAASVWTTHSRSVTDSDKQNTVYEIVQFPWASVLDFLANHFNTSKEHYKIHRSSLKTWIANMSVIWQ